MATDFFIPKLGENVNEVTIVGWLVEDGTEVEVDQEILEVETDKAVFPIPSNEAGYLHIGPFKAGDTVKVNEVVATIGDKGDSFSPENGSVKESDVKEKEAAAATATKAALAGAEATSEAKSDPGEAESDIAGDAPLRATPVAQRMAADLGVDLQAINGSGERGKITKDDVLEAASGQKSGPVEKIEEAPQPRPPQAAPKPETTPATPPKPDRAPAEPQPEPKRAPAAPPSAEGDILERVPLKGIRGVIARRMAESVQTTARVTLVTEADATELVNLREQLKARYTDEWGFAPGYNDLLAMIVSSALREFPYMNARISAEGDAIERLKPVHIGMAVDTDRGLLVTVIRNADKKGLREFGAEFRDMVSRARTGKSSPDELSGSTFSITSLGIYRVDAFTPVINLPEAAILGIGRIKAKPVVKDDEIVARKMITLSLVFDHRLADGAPAARFLDYICELIEDPHLLFLRSR